MTARSFLYYEMVKKCDIGWSKIWRYVTFARPLMYICTSHWQHTHVGYNEIGLIGKVGVINI